MSENSSFLKIAGQGNVRTQCEGAKQQAIWRQNQNTASSYRSSEPCLTAIKNIRKRETDQGRTRKQQSGRHLVQQLEPHLGGWETRASCAWNLWVQIPVPCRHILEGSKWHPKVLESATHMEDPDWAPGFRRAQAQLLWAFGVASAWKISVSLRNRQKINHRNSTF